MQCKQKRKKKKKKKCLEKDHNVLTDLFVHQYFKTQ